MGLRVAIVGEEAVGMPAAYFDELENRNEIVLLLSTPSAIRPGSR